MAEPRELDVTINKDDYQDEIQRVLKEIRPTWSRENIEIKVNIWINPITLFIKLIMKRVKLYKLEIRF